MRDSHELLVHAKALESMLGEEEFFAMKLSVLFSNRIGSVYC